MSRSGDDVVLTIVMHPATPALETTPEPSAQSPPPTQALTEPATLNRFRDASTQPPIWPSRLAMP